MTTDLKVYFIISIILSSICYTHSTKADVPILVVESKKKEEPRSDLNFLTASPERIQDKADIEQALSELVFPDVPLWRQIFGRNKNLSDRQVVYSWIYLGALISYMSLALVLGIYPFLEAEEIEETEEEVMMK